MSASQIPLPVQGGQADNVNIGSAAVKLPVLPALANSSNPSFTDGFTAPLSVDTSGNLRITIVDLLVSGTITGAAQTVDLNITNFSAAGLQITGGYNATLIVEGSLDVSTFVAIAAFAPNSSTVVSTITTGTTGIWLVPCAGYRRIRVRCSAYASGTATVNWRGCQAALVIPRIGQQTAAASEPVVIASDQSAIPISVASLPLPSGAATEATLAAFSGVTYSNSEPTWAATLRRIMEANLLELRAANAAQGLEVR